MKKLLFILSLFLISSTIFCESYKVTEVIGFVNYESNNALVQIENGQILDDNTYIWTGLNSFLTLETDKDIFVIKPMKKGYLRDFCVKKDKNNLILGSTLTKESIKNLKSDKYSKELGRASEAREDLEWE